MRPKAAGVGVLRIVASKLWQLIPVLFLVSLGSFFLLELVPGDPAVQVLGPTASPAEYERVREQLGLNEPIVERYVDWIGGVVTGDLGESVFPPNRTVWSQIAQRLPVTIEVAALSMLLSMVISVPIAMITANKPGGRVDQVATGVTFAAISVPVFLVGLLLVFFFIFHVVAVKVAIAVIGALIAYAVTRWGVRTVRLYPPSNERRKATMLAVGASAGAVFTTVLLVVFMPDFPRQGFVRITEGGIRENLKTVALPVMTLALTETAVFVRLLRSDLIETLGEDYILAARAKGMPVRRILVRDALRPSLFSLVTIMSVTLGRLIGGSAIVEIIFNLPGMGRLIIESIAVKDYPIVQASVLIIAVVYVLSSALVDVAYTYLDPRIRRGRV